MAIIINMTIHCPGRGDILAAGARPAFDQIWVPKGTPGKVCKPNGYKVQHEKE